MTTTALAILCAISAATPSAHTLVVVDAVAPELDPADAKALTAAVTARAKRFGTLEVVAPAKDAAVCDDSDAGCLSGIANAVNADLVLSTRAGKIEGELVVSLQLFGTAEAKPQGHTSTQAWSVAEVEPKLAGAVDELLIAATGERPADIVTGVAPKAAPAGAVDASTRTWLLYGGAIGAGVGVVAIIVGALPALAYGGAKDDLAAKTRAFDGSAKALSDAADARKAALGDKDLYNNAGRWGVLAGVVLVAAGGAAIGASFGLPEAP